MPSSHLSLALEPHCCALVFSALPQPLARSLTLIYMYICAQGEYEHKEEGEKESHQKSTQKKRASTCRYEEIIEIEKEHDHKIVRENVVNVCGLRVTI